MTMKRFSVLQLVLAVILVLLLVRAVQGSSPPNRVIYALAREFSQLKSTSLSHKPLWFSSSAYQVVCVGWLHRHDPKVLHPARKDIFVYIRCRCSAHGIVDELERDVQQFPGPLR